MTDEKSYLSFEGLKTLVAQIKTIVGNAAKDASTKAYDSAKSYSDSSLKAHIEAKDANNKSIHVSLADRMRWDAVDNAVSKTLFDASIEALKEEDASITTALGKTDASLADVSTKLNAHVTNTGIHITAAERTKWDGYATTITALQNKDSSLDSSLKLTDGSLKTLKETVEAHVGDKEAHIQTGERDIWNKWHDVSANYYDASKVDEKISALGAVLTFKGVVNSSAALDEKLASAKVGDVWHVNDTEGNEYVCIENVAKVKSWEVLGHTINLNVYATKTYVDDKISTINKSIGAIDTSITSLKSGVSTLNTKVKKLEEDSTLYEKVANKVDDITTVSDTDASVKYPSVKAVKAAIEAGVAAGDTRVKQSAISTGESPILMVGATKSGDAAEAKYVACVKIDASDGTLTAPKFAGNLTGNVTGDLAGNADSATKAMQDGNGKVIADTYATIDALHEQMVLPINTADIVDLFTINSEA